MADPQGAESSCLRQFLELEDFVRFFVIVGEDFWNTGQKGIWYTLNKNKRVIFTTHSKERIKKRGLTEEWVIVVITAGEAEK